MIQEELSPHGFTVLAVAVDESADAARPWVEEAGATFPVAYDRDHVVVERYGIINVPTVIWVDEGGRIVRPQSAEFPDDKLIAFHGRPSGPHLDQLRRWVVDGEAPLSADEARQAVRPPAPEEQAARLHYRMAVHLLRAGAGDAAVAHFTRAGELAPDDWTIRRGSLPLLGKDSFFSEEFIAMYQAWEADGRPGYRL